MASQKLIPGGFPEQNIVSQKRENVIKRLIDETYEKYGFVNVETPAIEGIDVLTAKGGNEISKQVFGLYGLAQGAEDAKKYALHFDLTVPLARYVIDHENELRFPFKRYQIQKVRRGERQQKGRFKEFYQCDVDVIDNDLDIYYDAEVIEVLYTTIQNIFSTLELQKDLTVKVNNKEIYSQLFENHDIDTATSVKLLAVIDAYYKYPSPKEFLEAMQGVIGEKSERFIQEIEQLTHYFKTGDTEGLSPELLDTTQDMSYVINLLEKNGVSTEFDPYIVRGLDYYDGTVFETYVNGHEDIGSICSGGRYSNLVGAIREKTRKNGVNYGGVGGSIGLSRLLYVMEQEGFLKKDFSLSDVMIFNTDEKFDTEEIRHEMAQLLRQENIRVDHYIAPDKLQKQFKYAESKRIPLGIFIEDSYQEDQKIKIKDLNSRSETFTYVNQLKDTVQSLLEK